ncbi:MAG: hypothetical protein B7Y37_12835 [Sphingobacteriia bacterium 28-36-52]|nr:MAG: hypothetical protein B7Y37_12835 [Sphingobacteriia bacterium 28-36-52]
MYDAYNLYKNFLMPPFEIDKFLTRLLNKMAYLYPKLDHFIYLVAENNLLKGGIVLTLFYFIWFDNTSFTMRKNRKRLIITMMAAFVAEITTILLSLTLPFRARPYTKLDMNFNIPVEIDHWWNKDISSFPSDHATLFIVLGYGIYKCNRKLGWIILSYIILFILLPRIYLGLHFTSDILGGILVGVIVMYFTFKLKLIQKIAEMVLDFSEKKPYFFYPIMFLIAYQLVDLFTETREIIGYLRHPLGKD